MVGTRDRGEQARWAVRVDGGVKVTSLICKAPFSVQVSLMAQTVKNPPANAGDQDSIPGLGKSPWRRKWQPTPVFVPRESNGQRSLVGYSPWGYKESDTTEHLTLLLNPAE